jgi:hypothetical protein
LLTAPMTAPQMEPLDDRRVIVEPRTRKIIKIID